MSDWIHCNMCYAQPLKNCNKKFMLTSCGHILCTQCLEQMSNNECVICKARCSKISLKKEMKPDISIYFQDPGAQMKKIMQVIDFQKGHRDRFTQKLQAIKSEKQTNEKNYVIASENISILEKENNKLKQENGYLKKLLASGLNMKKKQSPETSESPFLSNLE